MKLSEERASHLAHLIVDSVWKDDLADWSDDGRALRTVKQVLSEVLKAYEDVDAKVRKTMAGMARRLPEGSSEWDMTYRKLYQQELQKALK